MSAEQIVPGTTDAQSLQDAIQRDLIARGYSTEGDEVMAEFVFVMLCNNKKPEQITTELQDLIGSDFDPSFTNWLFSEVSRRYPNSKQALAHGPQPSTSSSYPQQSSARDSLRHDDRRSRPQRDVRPSAFGVGAYGQAMAGIKRPLDDRDAPPSQRQRMDPPLNAPTGPRRGLVERVAPRPSPQAYDSGSMQIDQGPPQPPQAPQEGQQNGFVNNGFPIQQQQQPMMFVQTPNGPMPVFFPMGSMPQFSPSSFAPAPSTPAPAPPAFQPAQQQQAPQQAIPTKPQDEGLCKYSTECKNAFCKFSHPSPVATKESGLVLSAEPCEKQLECTDIDCPKSHISPQAKDPAGSKPIVFEDEAGISRSHARPAPSYSGTAGRPCKFGNGCTRPGCAFTHPWDTSRGIPCRFGGGCTRPGCSFSHPWDRPSRGRGGYGGYANKGNRTAVFNTPGAVADKLEKTETEKAALSERLKKFSGLEKGEEVIPESVATANGSSESVDVKME